MTGLGAPIDARARALTTMQALREATHDAHEALELRLDLLSTPLSQARLLRILVRFESFHRAWEPWIEALIGRSEFLAPRRRVALLRADLAALGAAPECSPGPDLSWLIGASTAWGSLYVLEGSTLGGQVITKALSAEDRSPSAPAQISYFNGRGRQTGAYWRETTAAIEAQSLAGGRDQMIAGASRTFEVLTEWLDPPKAAARPNGGAAAQAEGVGSLPSSVPSWP